MLPALTHKNESQTRCKERHTNRNTSNSKALSSWVDMDAQAELGDGDAASGGAKPTAASAKGPATRPKKTQPTKSIGHNREAFLRINFLFQAAHLALRSNNEELARFYVKTLREVTRRLVLRLDPSIKRAICKECCSLLVPGISSTVRIRGGREGHMVVTCNHCKSVRRYETDSAHTLWSERTAAGESSAPPEPIPSASSEGTGEPV